MNPRRVEQVSQRIQMLVSDILQREVSDPRLATLVVNRVDLTSDGSFAKIYVSSYETNLETEEVFKVLRKATGFIRKNLSSKLDLRITPSLKFLWDDSIKDGEQVLSALRKLNADV